MSECYDAKLCEERHKQINDTFDLHERRLNDHSDRLKKIENQNVGTAKDVQNFKETLEDIKELIQKMTIQLDNLKEKPAKRWDGLIDKIITILAGVIIGKFLN
jgi:predicted  nucleic acid-binding Zn-ribbon protein